MKIPASIIALMCLNHPELSRPLRNSLIVGVFISQTKVEKEAEIEIHNNLSLFTKKQEKVDSNFVNEEAEAQKGEMISQEPHSESGTRLGLEPTISSRSSFCFLEV